MSEYPAEGIAIGGPADGRWFKTDRSCLLVPIRRPMPVAVWEIIESETFEAVEYRLNLWYDGRRYYAVYLPRGVKPGDERVELLVQQRLEQAGLLAWPRSQYVPLVRIPADRVAAILGLADPS